MKRILIPFFITMLALSAFGGKAFGQDSFVGGGAVITRSSSPDPSPLKRGDGGYTFGGAYAEGGLKLPYGFQARLLGEYSSEAALPTIFTRDEGADRRATSETRLRPEVRYWFGQFGALRPFVAGGVDYYRQSFKQVIPSVHEPESVEEEDDEYEYGSGVPQSGINPTFTVGTGIGQNHEASFTRLFEDNSNLNGSHLSGYRGQYSYQRHLYGRFDLKISGEADYLRFTENTGYGYHSADKYYEKDAIFRVRLGVIFK